MKQMSMLQMLFGLKQGKGASAAATNRMSVAEKLLEGEGKLTPMSVLSVDECKMASPESMNSMVPILEYENKQAGDEYEDLPVKDLPEYDDGSGDDGGDGCRTPSSDNGIRIDIPSDLRVSIVQPDDETMWKVATQIVPAFTLAGLGMVGAGLLLDTVQRWDIYVFINEMFIVTPSLLGLKGNLEMTLASRLSTQANLGTMNDKRAMRECILGNLALTQAQACILSILSGIVAMFLNVLKHGPSDLDHYLVFFPTIIVTASIATLALASITTLVVIGCHKLNLNPDNIATPIAASLGDISTLGLLAVFGNALYSLIDHMKYIGPLLLLCYAILIPMFVRIAYKNEFVKEAVVPSGWIAIVSAMFIATIAGFVFDIAAEHFGSLALYQPVVNGVGGNLVAIQASRISTHLHKLCHPGFAFPQSKICMNPFSVFFGSETHSRTARLLLIFVIPGHIIFAVLLVLLKTGEVNFSLAFVVFYLTAVFIQVTILLYLARIIVFFVWKIGRDPDNDSIPYLTALGDLFGILFLAAAFILISRFDSSILK